MSFSNTTITSAKQPELRNLLAEASRALAHLDADTLEEMALYCAALVGDDAGRSGAQTRLDSECTEASKEMAIFMRVLEATKANLNVMRRLREMRIARLEYDSDLSAGSDHGDH
jgi:hypothetical protein